MSAEVDSNRGEEAGGIGVFFRFGGRKKGIPHKGIVEEQ